MKMCLPCIRQVMILWGILCLCSVLDSLEPPNDSCSAEHECMYLREDTVKTTTLKRRWYCLFFCWREVTVYRTRKMWVCDCCPGYIMTDQECTACPENSFGMNCEEECACGVDQDCDHVTGWCQQSLTINCTSDGQVRPTDECKQSNCNNQCIGAQMCNHTTGTCECPSGWSSDCKTLGCNDGYFGQNCEQKCLCENQGTCDYMTGICSCPAGWTGQTCSDQCGPNTYGYNCSQTCHCPKEALSCDSMDGSCVCPLGFSGQNCSDPCPAGYFGHNCRHNCTCDLTTEICDNINGMCSAGSPTVRPPIARDPPGSMGSITGPVIGGVLGGLVLIGIAVFLFLRRRKTRRKKTRATGGHSTNVNLYEVSFRPDGSKVYADTREGDRVKTGGVQNVTYGIATDSSIPSSIDNSYIYPIHTIPDHEPAVTDHDTSNDDYSHLDRNVIRNKPETDNNDAYSNLQATSTDEYSHIDRGQRVGSMRVRDETDNDGYGQLVQMEEEAYNQLDRSTGPTRQPLPADHNKPYEVVSVQK